jgi:hypothetical protein
MWIKFALICSPYAIDESTQPNCRALPIRAAKTNSQNQCPHHPSPADLATDFAPNAPAEQRNTHAPHRK